ncbi:MAG: hypothetical protein ACHQD7_12120 [Chitinophagales bacterium]
MLLRNTILCLMLTLAMHNYAYSTDVPKTDSGTVIITLQNASDRQSRIDSIYLIFDRYDKRGAGIIRHVYCPKDNQVEIKVPRGRYYVNIYCLGIYNRAGFDRIITARPNRKLKILLKLQASSLFTPGMVEIPREKWDPAHLAIMHSHTSK